MALDQERRLQLLQRAVRLECRSFLEYVAESALPVDIEEYPQVAAFFREAVASQRALAERLVVVTEQLDAHCDLAVAFDPQYTFFNYVTTAYALQVLERSCDDAAKQTRALADEAQGDKVVGAVLSEVSALERRLLVMVRDLRRELSGADAEEQPAEGDAPAEAGPASIAGEGARTT